MEILISSYCGNNDTTDHVLSCNFLIKISAIGFIPFIVPNNVTKSWKMRESFLTLSKTRITNWFSLRFKVGPSQSSSTNFKHNSSLLPTTLRRLLVILERFLLSVMYSSVFVPVSVEYQSDTLYHNNQRNCMFIVTSIATSKSVILEYILTWGLQTTYGTLWQLES